MFCNSAWSGVYIFEALGKLVCHLLCRRRNKVWNEKLFTLSDRGVSESYMRVEDSGENICRKVVL